ncbi:MAG: DUF2868 domain-containing protein [Variovorax sp.]|nr:MAG: DUF2868 domain-containing protein [Variovorax sp.]
MLNTALRQPAFESSVITESIRWAEQTGPLDDAEALRQATAGGGAVPVQITARAAHLGRRIGLQDDLQRMRHASPLVLLALVAVIGVAGLAMAGNVVGGDRQINVMVALASLLGLHVLTLIFWLIGLALPAATLPTSLGALWLRLTARVAGGRRGQTPLLLRAATGLLIRARLLPWALGFVSHAIWVLSFAVVLAALLFALAFRNYTLSWETTILDPAFFVQAVESLGRVPGWLGFPVPDAQTVLAPQAATAGQRAWALWLTGCVLVYGLLPRLFFAGLCAVVWQARRRALQPDFSAPYYVRLASRIAALAPPRVTDSDPGRPTHATVQGLPTVATTDALVAIGFELPDDLPWPPEDLAARAANSAPAVQCLRIDGSAGQRRDALDRLAQQRPARVLIVCNGSSSPDRGTERFVRDVQGHSGECRLALMGVATVPARWRDWRNDAGLAAVQLEADLDTALRGWP